MRDVITLVSSTTSLPVPIALKEKRALVRGGVLVPYKVSAKGVSVFPRLCPGFGVFDQSTLTHTPKNFNFGELVLIKVKDH